MHSGRRPVLTAAATVVPLLPAPRTAGRPALILLAATLLAACATVAPNSLPQAPSAPTAPAPTPGAAPAPASGASSGRAAAAARPIETQPNVALLLPLTGLAAAAASTVRDGFMTAYYAGPATARPRIRLYDTGALSVAIAVQRAVEGGASFIVGPLTRPAVVAAAALEGARPPILALNYLPAGRPAPSAFYQFALSPEQEARQVARRIVSDGHLHGIALLPRGDWGDRVLAAFEQELSADGATLLDTARFDPGLSDLAPAIRAVLGIDASRARVRALESLVGSLHTESRRRQDIDFIFEASPSASTARLLRAEIRFYFAGDVAAYSTSDSYEPDPVANQELEGIEFPDMPWMLGGGLAEAVRTVASNAWPAKGPSQGRLFAFGFDAYRLLNALRAQPTGAGLRIEGLTGDLTLDAEHRVMRALEWAQMRNGEPHPLAPAQGTPAPAAPSSQAAPAAAAGSPRVRPSPVTATQAPPPASSGAAASAAR
jgi:uncharacterized protein